MELKQNYSSNKFYDILDEMDVDLNIILDDLISDLQNKISKDFNFFNININITNFNDFDGTFSDLTDDNKINLFLKTIDNKGNDYLKYIFNFIKKKEYRSKFLFNKDLSMTTDEMNESKEIAIHTSDVIMSLDIITSIKNPRVLWDGLGELEELNNFSLEIDNFNTFNNKIYINGKFIRDTDSGLYLDLLYHYDLYLAYDLYVINSNSNVHDFLIYLIEGFSYLENENYKMCLFHLYSSLDGFIQKIYKLIFNFYIEEYRNSIDKLKINLNKLYYKHRDYIDSNFQSGFISHSNKKYKKLDTHLKSKIKFFSNDTKKLNDKLSSIIFELGIKNRDKSENNITLKFKDLNNSIKNIHNVQDYRNNISHADNYVDIDRDDILKLFYDVLYIMSAISIEQKLVDLFD